MADYYYDQSPNHSLAISNRSRILPDYGVAPEVNPGEGVGLQNREAHNREPQVQTGAAQARNIPAHDIGSQVGVMRNLEYSAGGRSHRISTGPYTSS